MLGKGLESLIPPQSQSGDSSVAGKDGTDSSAPINPVILKNEPPQSFGNPVVEAKPAAEPIINQSEPLRPSPKKSSRPKLNEDQAVFHIEVEKIKPNPHQPRRNFDETGLQELAASIREFGLLQPIVVSKTERESAAGTEVEYQLIAGERRLLAVKLLGWERIPAIIRKLDLERERLEMAVIENIQRENLNPLERARAFSRLQEEFGLTQREIASRLAKSREAVANTVRLLDLPGFVQEALAAGQITESHGRLLLAVTEPEAQQRIFQDLVEKNLTTRDLKNRISSSQEKQNESQPAAAVSPELKMLQEKLSSELGAPVEIKQRGKTGRITISFYSPEELKNIINRLGGAED